MMSDIEILMMDRCTRVEAERLLKKGTSVYDDFEENFDFHMAEWDMDEEEQAEYRKMIEEKEPVPDWGIVEHEGKTYYIKYVC